ncbi:MAG: hypothetical protein U9R32_11705 [Bacteroidota bacterium]|nr:hypothetical protein [Bacteroidota bacterium]
MKKLISKARYRLFSMIFIFVVATTFFSSCVIGDDGADGRAYLALSYQIDKPDFVDAGTSSIPEVFFWDEYYRVVSGFYTFYYDGVYFSHGGFIEYAWEVNYEIYVLRGEDGGVGYNGDDAPDMYFNIECNPYGPSVYEEEDYKTSVVNDMKIISATKDEIVLQQEKNGFGVKVTYKKVEKR